MSFWDYDNGMLNMRPTHSHFTQPAAMAPLARIQTTPTALHKPYDPALAFTPQAKALAWGTKRFQVSGTMITACKHKQPLSHSNHGTIGESPTTADLTKRFGWYTTSKGAGLSGNIDYDNGMLNTSARAVTFLYQVTCHRHGTIGEGYISGNPHTEAYRSRFGWYSTSHGIGIKADSDYDNGMLNKRPRYHIQSHGTIGDDPTSQGQTLKDLRSRFGFYTTSKGVGLSATYDYDNGMLNTTSDDVPLTLTCPY